VIATCRLSGDQLVSCLSCGQLEKSELQASVNSSFTVSLKTDSIGGGSSISPVSMSNICTFLQSSSLYSKYFSSGDQLSNQLSYSRRCREPYKGNSTSSELVVPILYTFAVLVVSFSFRKFVFAPWWFSNLRKIRDTTQFLIEQTGTHLPQKPALRTVIRKTVNRGGAWRGLCRKSYRTI